MKIIRSRLFDKFPGLIFGFSTKIGLDRKPPYYFNMSKSVGDSSDVVDENRSALFNELGIDGSNVVFQKQIHSDIVRVIREHGKIEEGDAMITDRKGLSLAVSTADCIPIFLYDEENNVIAGIHSGWRSTKEKILLKTLNMMSVDFHSKPENLWAYIAPSISAGNYEVGKEFEGYFPAEYLTPKGDKFLLDLKTANYDMLTAFGILEEHIEISNLCSFEEEYLHSYRRDGKISGRALGIIGLAN